MLIILTAVEKVAINFGKENEEWLSDLTVEEAQKYVDEGHFAAGSMLPKVQAAMDFASSGSGRTAMITLLEKARDGIQGKTRNPDPFINFYHAICNKKGDCRKA